MPEVCVVNEHHQVLTPWSELRRKLGTPPAVFTLDHHTDVLPAFGRFADGNETLRRKLIDDFDWRSDGSVQEALQKLRHDEHIDLAVRSGVISSCRILSHENFTVPANEKISVYLPPEWPDGDTMLNKPEIFRPYADRMLESSFLRNAGFEAERWILDIDLDCLLTRRAAMPEDGEYFRYLWSKSELVTISLEHDWVRLLRLPGENITPESLLELLRQTV